MFWGRWIARVIDRSNINRQNYSYNIWNWHARVLAGSGCKRDDNMSNTVTDTVSYGHRWFIDPELHSRYLHTWLTITVIDRKSRPQDWLSFIMLGRRKLGFLKDKFSTKTCRKLMSLTWRSVLYPQVGCTKEILRATRYKFIPNTMATTHGLNDPTVLWNGSNI